MEPAPVTEAPKKAKPARGGFSDFLKQKAEVKQEIIIESRPLAYPGNTLDPNDPILPVFNESDFEEMNQIGKGAFGVVYSAFHKPSQTKVAIKKMRYEGAAMEKNVRREYKITKDCSHPNVVFAEGLYCDDSNLFLVMELLTGKQLTSEIPEIVKSEIEKEKKEETAKAIMKQLLTALDSVHQKNIAHLDIKPDNIIVSENWKDNTSEISVKLFDFGLSREISESDPLNKLLGTPMLCAPEMFEGRNFAVEADMWSLGCVLYLLLSGREAFPEKNRSKLNDLVVACQYDLEAEPWNNISDTGKDLVRRMLCYDQATRITAANALNHAWIVEV